MNTTVIIVENDQKLSGQLNQSFETTTRIVCVGTYASVDEALPNIMKKCLDVVLMDINPSEMSGRECLEKIERTISAIQVLTLPDHLLDVIDDVCKGGAPMCSSITCKLTNYFHQIGISPPKSDKLSARQREIMGLLKQGFTYKQIGDQLEIKPETVRAHIKAVRRKMNVGSRMEAVVQFLN